MTEIVPFEFRGTTVRVVTIDGEPWFVAADVTFVLGYSNGRDAVEKHIRDHQRNTVAIRDGKRGNPNATVISEGGLYRLMLRANTVLADEFQDWVTDDVLPTIRQRGSYGIPADLPPAEYARRMDSARSAYFRSLAARSAKTRARRKQQGDAA